MKLIICIFCLIKQSLRVLVDSEFGFDPQAGKTPNLHTKILNRNPTTISDRDKGRHAFERVLR